jgi:hypothetical protein
MRFKEFLLNEELGLGNLDGTMSRLFGTQGFQNYAGAYVSSDVSGSEQSPTLGFAGHSLFLPDTDLEIPKVERVGRIKLLLKNRNPILVQLSDGTQANFTYDEWKRIEGDPAVGKMMRIIFQRHPGDSTETHSKIDHVIVTD